MADRIQVPCAEDYLKKISLWTWRDGSIGLLDSEGIATLMTRWEILTSLWQIAQRSRIESELHFRQHSLQRGQQASRQWSGDLLRLASNHFEFLSGFVAAFCVATAFRFAES
jgi:hypothetical protein